MVHASSIRALARGSLRAARASPLRAPSRALAAAASADAASPAKALGSRQQERALRASMVESAPTSTTSLMFSTHDGPGSLADVLAIFKSGGVNLTRIESRPQKRGAAFDFVVDFEGSPSYELLDALRRVTASHSFRAAEAVPWFPSSVRDIDAVSAATLDAGADLEADHPGFSDEAYRARRFAIVEAARAFKHGEAIPRVAYSAEEAATWALVYAKLRTYTKSFAVGAYNRIFPLLEKDCGYDARNVPQLEDISQFLQSCTGFRLRPVGGLLSARDFLNGLAFRVFFSTQYIRHHSVPLYTPEPDICHELLGHAPMFADPDFADFSQDIGLASLGASDEDIKRLAACYWFSVEFGVCMEKGQRKAYGAGLLSSFGELEYSCAPYRPAGGEKTTPEYRPWDPARAAVQPYPITKYQRASGEGGNAHARTRALNRPLFPPSPAATYFVADSLSDAKERMLTYCDSSLARSFRVRYDPYTQSVTTDRAISRGARDLSTGGAYAKPE
jgi:phenylalanine-4-hydroxylase